MRFVPGVTLTVLCLALVMAADEPARLPEGASGLAARYPGDVGLEDDPAVLFVERYDQVSIDELTRRYDEVQHAEIMKFAADGAPGTRDGQSLLLTHVGGQGNGGSLYRRIQPNQNVVFARWYVKFDPDCWPIHHFGTHLGGQHPVSRWPNPRAGERPPGEQRFTCGLEPYGKDWGWDFYTYWNGMHVHGDGRYWGTPFLSGVPKPAVARGPWICAELMVKMNDPADATNGEQAFWIDGRLARHDGQVVSHVGPGFPRGRWTGGWWHPDAATAGAFEGYRWRTRTALALNYVWTYLYITAAPAGHVSRVWFDNLVLATAYIGPSRNE